MDVIWSQLALSWGFSTSPKCEVKHYLHHGGKDPPISAPQTEEQFVLPQGANNLTWKQEAAVESSQGPQRDLSPQISRSDGFLDLTKQPSWLKENHTARTLPNRHGSTEDTSDRSKRPVHRQFLVLVQDAEFEDLTAAPTPNYRPLARVSVPLHSPSAEQAERSCLHLGSAGTIKSLILLNILKLLHGYLQKCQCYLIQWLSEHCFHAAGETIMYPANCVMLYTGIEIVFWSLWQSHSTLKHDIQLCWPQHA